MIDGVEFEEDINAIQPLVLNRPVVIKSPLARYLMAHGIRSQAASYAILLLISLCFFAASFMLFSMAKPEAIPYTTQGLRSVPIESSTNQQP